MKWLLLILFAGFLSGCDDLRSVKENIPVPRQERAYVAAFLCPEVPHVWVTLLKITPALGDGYEPDDIGITNATVQIIDQDGKILTVPDSGRADYRVLHKGFIRAGGRYRLLVTTPRGDRLESVCSVPKTYVDPSRVSAEETKEYRFQALWADISPEREFYALTNHGSYLNITDGRFPSIGSQQVFQDRSVGPDGRFRSAGLGTYGLTAADRLTQPNVFFIAHTDSAYYHYHKSYNDVEIARQNPFAEPINLYSNITGGYGIFAGFVRRGFRYDGKKLTVYR